MTATATNPHRVLDVVKTAKPRDCFLKKQSLFLGEIAPRNVMTALRVIELKRPRASPAYTEIVRTTFYRQCLESLQRAPAPHNDERAAPLLKFQEAHCYATHSAHNTPNHVFIARHFS